MLFHGLERLYHLDAFERRYREKKHYKGEWAGKTFEPEPWEWFVLLSLFGIKYRATKKRKYIYADVYVPRKNGKTTLAAIIALIMLIIDGEPAAEVYAAAVDKAQAKICFDASVEIAKASGLLEDGSGIRYFRKGSIVVEDTASAYKPLSKDTKNKDGLNIHCGICDERHAWRTNEIYEVLKTGIGARSQPLIFSISTAGTDTSYPYFNDLEFLRQVMLGIKEKDNHFLLLFCPDEGDAWDDPETWKKVNPNLGVSLSLDYMRNECNEAKLRGGTYQQAFCVKNLNMWVDAPDVWIPDEDIEANNAAFDESQLATLDCYYAPLVITHPGTSVVERLTGGGLVHKGANNNEYQPNNVLRIKGVAPFTQAKTRIRMANHSVVSLDYEGVATNLPVTAGIYVRFDASRPDTIDTETVDGKRYVTAWRDADGRGVTATPFTGNAYGNMPHGQRPWLSEVTSANGCPLVDFGAFENANGHADSPYYDSLKETLGPSASLVFPATTQAREVFIVWQDTQSTGTCSFVVRMNFHTTDETYLDGVRRSYTFGGPYDLTRLSVVSANFSQGAILGTLAQDRNLRFGGARIAEVIIYTQELSSLERQAVHAYLQRKWTSNAKFDPIMLRDIQVDASNQIFEVPEGRTVDVGLLKVLSSQTFVKTGDGTLNVDTLANDGVLKLDVRGGAVTFNRMLTGVDDAEPAPGPMFWLDATAADSFVHTNLEHGVAGRDYIHRWNDCRPTQTKYYAYPMSQAIDTNRPFVVANAANGHAVVDFGTGIITNKNAPWNGYSPDAARLRFNANVDAYDGFVVLRMNNPASHYDCANGEKGLPSLFGVDTQGFTRWGTDKLLAQYADADPLTAYWCIDGVSYVPFYDTFDFGTNDFHVVGFSQLKTIRVNRLADDRSIVFGGQQIGEVLFYDRPLSEHERRQTEAYLMKKWKNKTSPALHNEVNLNTVTFAEGVAPVLSSDRPLTVAALNAANDATITQKGGGTVTLPPEPLDAVRGYVADGGTLLVTLPDPFSDAFYHFDATDAESVVDDGAGGVTQWLDTRRNGMAAVSVIMGMSVAKPTLKTVETRNGKTMPVLDFGDASKSGSTTSSTSAGMDIRRNNANLGEADGCVKEVHVVYCDAGTNFDGYKQRFIFADHGYYQFHRGESNGQMFGAYGDPKYGEFIRNGSCYVAVDGEPKAYSYNLTDKQFHVISAAPTRKTHPPAAA